jgi:hypothetical protein
MVTLTDHDIKALEHPDPKVHIPRLQKLVEGAWGLKTIRKVESADDVTFSFTISKDKLPADQRSLFALALSAMT